jgi:hypothetical protein
LSWSSKCWPKVWYVRGSMGLKASSWNHRRVGGLVTSRMMRFGGLGEFELPGVGKLTETYRTYHFATRKQLHNQGGAR